MEGGGGGLESEEDNRNSGQTHRSPATTRTDASARLHREFNHEQN